MRITMAVHDVFPHRQCDAPSVCAGVHSHACAAVVLIQQSRLCAHVLLLKLSQWRSRLNNRHDVSAKQSVPLSSVNIARCLRASWLVGLLLESCVLATSKKGKFALFNDASRGHWFSYHRLLGVKQMVIVTYFFKGNPLSPHRLLLPISSKRSFIYTFPQTGQYSTYRSLWWTSCGPLVGMENMQGANAFTMQNRSAKQEDPNLYRVLYHLSYVLPARKRQV